MHPQPDERQAARDRFIADFSHEVRSPLHAIIGFSELLSDEAFGKLNPQQETVVGDIHCAAQYLLQLINDVLDLSRLSLSNLELQPEVLPLAVAVEQAVQIARGLAHEKQITIEAQIAPDVAVCADERRVIQILNNILANAVRYSPPQTVVQIAVELEPEVVWTVVRDHGFGIPATDVNRIFEAFVAVKCGDAEPGAGLGLSVSRRLVEAMGGEIKVDSAPGQGSVFRFSLPRAEVPG